MIGPLFEAMQKLLLKNLCNRKMYTYILLVDDEVVMQSQQTIAQTKVIQEVVSPEVSTLNHAVVNKK